MIDYKKETERICKFIREYVNESGANGIVLGMSGGVDSAVVAALCLKSGFRPYDPKNPQKKNLLYMYYLPVIHNDDDKNWDCLESFCYKFNLFPSECIDIAIGDCEHQLAMTTLCAENQKVARGNIKARTRMIILYSFANQHNCLVAGTTNKSEHEIGYFTKHGDGACDFEPIQHLYKTEVFELAKYLGIPNCIIEKAPSADLWEGQTDEGEIGFTYKKLDEILEWNRNPTYKDIEGRIVPCVSKGITRKDITAIQKKVSDTNHKRGLPPCLSRI
jgi:NAD+ synthase